MHFVLCHSQAKYRYHLEGILASLYRGRYSYIIAFYPVGHRPLRFLAFETPYYQIHWIGDSQSSGESLSEESRMPHRHSMMFVWHEQEYHDRTPLWVSTSEGFSRMLLRYPMGHRDFRRHPAQRDRATYLRY